MENLLSWIKALRPFVMWSLLSAVLFLAVLFPLKDLSDLVSTKVAALTQNQVYVQFADLHITVFPTPGLRLEQVSLDMPGLPTLLADDVKLRPSIPSLIRQRLGGTVQAEGLFRGETSISVAQKDETVMDVSVKANDIQLQELRDLVRLPVSLRGKLSGHAESLLDLNLAQQPQAQFSLNLEQLLFPNQMVQTLMGPLGLPEVKASRIDVRGELKDGELRVDELRIGKEGEELSGLVKGQMKLEIKKIGNAIVPIPGPYSFEVDLAMTASLQDRAVLFLSFIDQFKVPRGQETRYQFKISATNPALPPQLTKIR